MKKKAQRMSRAFLRGVRDSKLKQFFIYCPYKMQKQVDEWDAGLHAKGGLFVKDPMQYRRSP